MKKIIISIIISSFLSQASFAEPFVGEIRNFAGVNFCPRGWTKADGQLLAVSQYDALFSLFGTIYGGDGRTTFGLPDLRGRMAIHAGNAPSLTNRALGSKGGSEREFLTVNQIPNHSHGFVVKQGRGVTKEVLSSTSQTFFAQSGIFKAGASSSNGTLHPNSLGSTGAGTDHENMGPSLVTNFCVALVGVYPSRN